MTDTPDLVRASVALGGTRLKKQLKNQLNETL